MSQDSSDACCSLKKCACFFVEVMENSMTSVNDITGDSFKEGDHLLVTSRIKAKHGDYVIAGYKRQKQSGFFRQFVIEDNECYLKALNPDYPAIKFEAKTMKIVGVIKYSYRATYYRSRPPQQSFDKLNP